MEILRSLLYSHTKDWLFGYLQPADVPKQEQSISLIPNKEYVSLWLKYARITKSRRGFKRFLGIVHCHSSIAVLGSSQDLAHFHFVSTPSEIFEGDSKGGENIVVRDKPILGPLPYRGGNLTIDAGLFSVQSVDMAANYLSLLNNISQAAGVSYVNMAEPFVAPLQKGIDLLVGADNQILETGFSTVLSSITDTLKTGYLVVGRVEASKVDCTEVEITSTYQLKMKATGELVTEWPYMVFQVVATKTRDDYFRIPDIKRAHEKFQAALQDSRLSDQDRSDAFGSFRRVVLTSNDLLREHGRQLVQAAEADWKEISLPAMQSQGTLRPTVRSLDDLSIEFTSL